MHILSLFIQKRPQCSLLLEEVHYSLKSIMTVRLILLGFLLHLKDQLPVGGVPVYLYILKWSRSKSQKFSQLRRENGELLQEVETTIMIWYLLHE